MAGQSELLNFTEEGKGRNDKTSEVIAEGPYELPEGWEWVELEEVTSSLRNGFACSKEHEVKEGVPHLRPNNIGFNGNIDLFELVRLPKELVDLNKYSLKKGDVLFNNTNSKELVGRAALVNEKMDYGFSNHITKIRTSSQLLPSWLVASLNRLWSQGYFLRICRKWVGQAGVNNEMLKSVKIPLPPLKEQGRIVARIEKFNSKIEEIKKLKKISKERSEKVMQATLHKFFSKAEEKEWKWVKLGDVTHINRETRNPAKEKPNEEFRYIEISEVGEGRIKQAKKILGRDAPSRARRIVHVNDVIMSTVRPYLKAFAVVPEKYDGQVCSTGFAVLSSRNNLLPRYLLYTLLSDTTIQQCGAMMMGAHYPALRIEQVSQVKIPLPPFEEQCRIVARIEDVKKNMESLRTLQRKKDKDIEDLTLAILDKAFKGEL